MACRACARPISPPSGVTAALFDMFCGLKGNTRSPRFASARHSPATSSDFAHIRTRALKHYRSHAIPTKKPQDHAGPAIDAKARGRSRHAAAMPSPIHGLSASRHHS
jgi:hypothetical protein